MANFDSRRDPDETGDEVFSRPVRAGRRTYFFDVKATRNNDYYLTITESRKRLGVDGSVFYDKNKIHLYKEDFAKFGEGLGEVIGYIKQHKPEFFITDSASAGYTESLADDEFDKL